MYSYVVYGLGLRSTVPLPELVTAARAVDVVVQLGAVDRLPCPEDATGAGFGATGREAHYSLTGVGAFRIRDGREITVDPAPGVDERALRLSILGPVMAVLLHQRKQLVLHASAIAAKGGAVLFLGGRGWGKSTLAAAFHARGHRVLADDLTPVSLKPHPPTVFPGFPQLKLWPDALASLGEFSEMLPLVHPLLQKRAHKVARDFDCGSLPLRRAYVLADGVVPVVEALKPDEAMIEVIRHWYGARFGERLLRAERGGADSHFRQCVALVRSVRVARLRRPSPLSALDDLVSVVEDDLGDVEPSPHREVAAGAYSRRA